MSRYTVPSQGGPLVREFSNRTEADRYAATMRKDGWPAAVTDRRSLADHERRMAYDGEGTEVGSLTLAEASARYGKATYESDSDTITVGE